MTMAPIVPIPGGRQAEKKVVWAESMERRWNELAGRTSIFVTVSFATFLNTRPITVMAITFILCATLTGLGLYITPPWLDLPDPKSGFNARRTDLSGRVSTWTKLDDQFSWYPDQNLKYFHSELPQNDGDDDVDDSSARRKRQVALSRPQQKITPKGRDNDAIESVFTGFFTATPCVQLSVPLPQVEHFSQFVFESSSFENLFTTRTMNALCAFQSNASDALSPARKLFENYPHFWSLPNYVSCFHGLLSCHELTENHIKSTASALHECYPYKTTIINCQAPPETRYYWKELYNCSSIPKACRSKYFFDIFYFILSDDAANPNRSTDKPVFVNVVTPLLQWEAYAYLHKTDVTSELIVSIYDRVHSLAKNVDNLRLKGVNMGVKFNVFVRTLLHDCYYLIAALILVFSVIWLYSGSLFFTCSVLLGILLSIGVAYFVYHIVFRLTFFPFMNTLVVVLLVGIGADDTFFLKHIMDAAAARRTRRSPHDRGVPQNTDQNNRLQLTNEDMHDALSHAALSMFVCSATNAAAFYANLVSDIVVVKCFGVFAGTTMLINYLLVITWLPASLIVLNTYVDPWWRKVCCNKVTSWLSNVWAAGSLLPNYFLLTALPRFVMKLKYFWIFLFSLLFATACFVVFYKPGLKLPERNPVQMFKPSNEFEWYDDTMEEHFVFARSKYRLPVNIAIVWGVRPVDTAPLMAPDDAMRNMKANFVLDENFRMSTDLLREIDHVCQDMNKKDFIYESVECFSSNFFTWSSRQSCGVRSSRLSNDTRLGKNLCCNVISVFFREQDIVRCLADWSTEGVTDNGGPIFRYNDMDGVDGVVLFYDTKFNWTTEYKGLKAFYTAVDPGVKEVLNEYNLKPIKDGWMVTSFYYTMQWYDLQRSLTRCTPIGIIVSVSVGLIVAAATMRAFLLSILSIITVFAISVVIVACLILLNWHLNVVESVLILLTVGLAFDSTLNYAVAYQLTPKGSREEKVRTVLQYMGMPVFLSFFTTFIAGVALLPSATMAFYQIGLFMVLVGVISWLYSALFFLSLLAVVGPEESEWTMFKKLLRRTSNQNGTQQPQEMSTVRRTVSSNIIQTPVRRK